VRPAFRSVCVSIVLAIVAAVPCSIGAEAVSKLSVRTGQSVLVPAGGLLRAAIGDPKIAGKTGRQNFDLVVIDHNFDDLRRMIQTSVDDPAVHVVGFGTSIVLDGNVATGEQLVHIGEILTRYEPIVAANKYTIVNAVTVAQPLGALQNELAVDGKVVDRLESATISQVDVKVYILEVDETALRDLGINLQSASFQNNGTYVLGAPQFPVVESPAGGAGIVGRALTLGGFFRTFTLAPTLNLILQSGHARVLSSPDLVTLPGREANFLVGGQIPVPYASGPQQVAIAYKDFGVQLKVTPTS
jgi:Flp pilus assembly secretin CpaC